MNDVILQLMQHRSIRKFKADPVADELLNTMIMAGQMASTSSNIQAYSVISIEDAKQRKRIMELSGNQPYISEAPRFLVWCADLFRLTHTVNLHAASAIEKGHFADSTENMIAATVDVALAAQNAAIAAESLGLGVVFIGGIRNQIDEVTALLKLPKLVYPVFGMCIGYPAQAPQLRPRLPLASVLHKDSYSKEHSEGGIAAYDQDISEYMLQRSGGKSDVSWSEQMSNRLKTPTRMHMKSFLKQQGFMRR